jgi:hypothetical protein
MILWQLKLISELSVKKKWSIVTIILHNISDASVGDSVILVKSGYEKITESFSLPQSEGVNVVMKKLS